MIRAIALDEEQSSLEQIKKLSSQTGYINVLKTFTKSEDALRYLNNYPVDLFFADISMRSASGSNFKKMVPANTMLICATAHAGYAVEGFNLNALDYLLKPFNFERFLCAAEKAKAYYQFIHQNSMRSPENISLRVDYALMKVELSKIIYIEGMDDYIRIFMHDQKPVITRMTMKALEEKLPRKDFSRVHRSYIVPVNKINFVRNKVVYIDKYEIPVGICYEEKFYNAITNTGSAVNA